MTKDFIHDYRQHCWEFAAAEHARIVNRLEQFKNFQPYKDSWMERDFKRKSELEEKYPTLKEK